MRSPIKNIRINNNLSEILEHVPKGTSYSSFILDKFERLEAHELNSVCWVVSSKDLSENRMSNGVSPLEGGKHPIFDEVIKINREIPKTDQGEELTQGWLGLEGEITSFVYGGFASLEAARTYIKKFLKGRRIPESFLDNKSLELYTTAQYDEYFFIEDYFYDREIIGLTVEELEAWVRDVVKKENEKGNGFLGTIEDIMKYLFKFGVGWSVDDYKDDDDFDDTIDKFLK